MILHPDIPEDGPKIGTPAERNAAGFFVGGPMPATPAELLRRMGQAQGRLVFADEKPAAPTQAERRAARRARKAQRDANLAVIRDEIRLQHAVAA